MTVVFTDTFTVGANADIDAYPATPDYAYMTGAGSGADLQVFATNDNVRNTAAGGADKLARIINGAVPSTDQEITADCYAESSGAQSHSGVVATRCDTGNDWYQSYLDLLQTDEVRLWRVNGGSFSLVASRDNGIAGNGTRETILRATGTTTVALTLTIGGTTALTFNDTSASRHETGVPGVGGWNGSANIMTVDNVSVDDLAAPGGRTTRNTRSAPLGVAHGMGFRMG